MMCVRLRVVVRQEGFQVRHGALGALDGSTSSAVCSRVTRAPSSLNKKPSYEREVSGLPPVGSAGYEE